METLSKTPENINRSATMELGSLIGSLKDHELLLRFGKLVQTERKITHLVLECVAEIDVRRLYLDRGYHSLYEFLTQNYGYSPTSALRRIEAARLFREIPEVSKKIEEGALNLSQLSKVQQAARTLKKQENRQINSAEKKNILSKIEFKNQDQTELLIAQEFNLPLVVHDKKTINRDESVTMTITFTKEEMDFLKTARDVVSHSVPDGKWPEVITYLAKKEIKRRRKNFGSLV